MLSAIKIPLILSALLLAITFEATQARAEEIGDYEAPAKGRVIFKTPADGASAIKADIRTPLSKAPEDAPSLKIGQEDGMAASCGGPSCTGVSTVLCPINGLVTGYVQNDLDFPIKVTLTRLECAGKDKSSMFCPSPGFLANVCSNFGGK